MSWFEQLQKSISSTLDDLITKLEDANPDIVYDNAIKELKKQHKALSASLQRVVLQKNDSLLEEEEGQALRDQQAAEIEKKLQCLQEKIETLRKEKDQILLKKAEQRVQQSTENIALQNVREHIAELYQSVQHPFEMPSASDNQSSEISEKSAETEEPSPKKPKKVQRRL